MAKTIGEIKFTETDNGLRIDVTGDKLKQFFAVCCCSGSKSDSCCTDSDIDERNKDDKES